MSPFNTPGRRIEPRPAEDISYQKPGNALSGEEIAAILADPDWMPHRLRKRGRLLQLVHLPRAEQRALAFLDHRFISDAAPRLELSVSDIPRAADAARSDKCHYIFHSAFCCSTLLSRALDVDGVATVFKEPRAIHDLACILPSADWPADQELALNVVLDLMQRSRRGGESTLIKPSNLANPLMERMLEVRPESKALLMYASLPAFLLSVVRGRRLAWARQLAAFYRRHMQFSTHEKQDLCLLTDLKVAAFLWLQQQAQFARVVRELPRGRVATLRADVFRARPAQAIEATAVLFGLQLSAKDAAQIASGPLFGSHSKRQGEVFDALARKREEAIAKLAYGHEIEDALAWATNLAADAAIPMDLSAPLISYPSTDLHSVRK